MLAERVGARAAALAVVAAALVAVVVAPPAKPASMSVAAMRGMAAMGMKPGRSLRGESLRERFDYLSRQDTNSCTITPAALAAMPATKLLQGACCSKMGYAEYAKQIPAIARYNREHGTSGVVPSDPYDMSVGFVRKLTSFNDTILLSNSQQEVYTAAFRFASDKAPCCCHCYRWTAFEGQAKYLIAERRYTAREVAAVWNLDDGCGSGSMGAGM